MLVCVVEGYPSPFVMWTKSNITQDFISTISNGVATARIESSSAEREGMYICSASNVAGFAEQGFIIGKYILCRALVFTLMGVGSNF